VSDPAEAGTDIEDDAGPAYVMDEEERAAFIAAVQEGVEQADARPSRPFEDYVPWLLSWGKEDELPPPA
jgi:predicted transcriptional regulator